MTRVIASYAGTGAPYAVDVVKEDGNHLVVGKVPGQYMTS